LEGLHKIDTQLIMLV